MARLVTTMLDVRGWLTVHRVGGMLTAEGVEPSTAYVVAPGGRRERCLARRVCLYEQRGAHLAASPGGSAALEEQAVRHLLGWHGGESLVRPTAGTVRRAGVALRQGPGLRSFVVAAAAPSPRLTQDRGWGPGCPREAAPPGPTASADTPSAVDLVVLLDRPCRVASADLLTHVIRQARDVPAVARTGVGEGVGDGLSVALVHPSQRPHGLALRDESVDEQLRTLTLAVREATADALAAAGWRSRSRALATP